MPFEIKEVKNSKKAFAHLQPFKKRWWSKTHQKLQGGLKNAAKVSPGNVGLNKVRNASEYQTLSVPTNPSQNAVAVRRIVAKSSFF